MKKIPLKYAGKCVECGRWIPEEETAYWEKGKGVWHLECEKTRAKHARTRSFYAIVSAVAIVAFILGGLILAPVLRPNTTTTTTITQVSRTTVTLLTTLTTVISENPTTTPATPTQTGLPCKGNAKCWQGTVNKIVDGDTLVVDSIRIRLAIVDTPEWNQTGGSEATHFAETLCPVGSKAIVDQDDYQLTDTYGRMVAVVWCSGKNLNAELLYSGLGHIDAYFCARSEFGMEEWAKKYGC